MTKKAFIESLDELIFDNILITDKVNIIENEISENCWSISADKNLIAKLEISDIRIVLEKIKINRSQQLNQAKIKTDLIYYSWFDEQAFQLRFNFINSNHKELPFNSKVRMINSEDEIIAAFLSSNNNRLAFKELEDVTLINIEQISKDEINVYKEILKKTKK